MDHLSDCAGLCYIVQPVKKLVLSIVNKAYYKSMIHFPARYPDMVIMPLYGISLWLYPI